MSARAQPKKPFTASRKGDSHRQRPARRGAVIDDSTRPPSFPVVGIGASAGGLEAFTQLLSGLPDDTGMAFVLIQHLDPQHDSLLTQALARATTMPVAQIGDGMVVERNHVYVIPPNADAAILHGALTLLPRSSDPRRPHLPVDFFFRALAADLGNQAIGIVLSGTASDGTAGLKAIKAENGIALVQEPASAKFSGMPQSAIDAGVADATLTPAEMADELKRLARHPYFALSPGVVHKRDDETLKKIFAVVRNAVGVDYSEYKPATLERRLGRRMALRNIGNREAYLKLLLEDPDEARFLYEDVLIHVTSFFRDPEVFEQLKQDAFPTIVGNKAEGTPIRVWVAGCSTGEEVYSLAISLLEFLDDAARSRPIQIFGTDISEKAIDVARTGVYSDVALRDVSDERRRRFFTKVDRGYRISKSVRELCVFVQHDLARDPPFSKLDLVSCRNVLIYFGAALQKRIIATFHYCLNHPGFLLLGRTESISGFSQFFARPDRGGKTFARTARRSTLSFVARAGNLAAADKRLGVAVAATSSPTADVGKYIDRLLLSKYAPAGVLVNQKLDILQFRGRTGAFLEPAAGTPQHNLLKMAREGLLAPLRMAFVQAQKTKAVARRKGVLVGENGGTRRCDITVAPLAALPNVQEPLFLALFENSAAVKPQRQTKSERKGKRRGVAELEDELASTRQYLESLVEEHAHTNDDLAAANEEFVSSNEELQSMNEELETAKEELQSTNEELNTVNDELHSRNQEVSQSNADLLNLLNNVEIPVVMLDTERRIKRFTPTARAVLNVQPMDVGRPIGELKPNVAGVDLDEQVASVVASGKATESEVQDRAGHWYRMQVRPSQDAESKIDGAILSLIDIDALKHHVADAEWARDYALDIVEAVQVPLVVLDEELRVLSANRAFYATFQTTEASTQAQRFFDLDQRQWNIPELRAPLEQMLSTKSWLADLEVEHDFPRVGRRVIRVSACVVHSRTNVPMILLALEDITDRKQAEDERAGLLVRAEAAKEEAERANRTKDEFLAMLSHELRTPLATLLMQAQLLRRGGGIDAAAVHRIAAIIERNTRLQIQLIDDLLDVSRIVAGKLTIAPEDVDLAGVVQSALENVSALAQTKGVRFSTEVAAGAATVSADPVRMVQVVSNLLTNAVKFSPQGGRVAVTLTTADGSAVVRVSDEGRGIDPEFLPHVFDRFRQQDSSTTRVFGGLGLGLAIVRHIVDLHGGTVRAESPGVGKGATFSVTLPLVAVRPAAAEMSPTREPKPSSGPGSGDGADAQLQGMRVLVVDDDAAIRETTSEILGMLGASVVTTPSAAEALQAIERGRFDVVLCDIAMPEEDGFGFIRRLRALDSADGGATPAIAFTALAGDQNRARSLKAGFQLHLLKPIDIASLTRSLIEVSDGRRRPN